MIRTVTRHPTLNRDITIHTQIYKPYIHTRTYIYIASGSQELARMRTPFLTMGEGPQCCADGNMNSDWYWSWICIYIYIYIYTHTHTWIPGYCYTSHIHTWRHTHTHTHTRRLLLHTYFKQIWTRTNIYIRTHRLTQIHVHEGIPTQSSLYPETLRQRTVLTQSRCRTETLLMLAPDECNRSVLRQFFWK